MASSTSTEKLIAGKLFITRYKQMLVLVIHNNFQMDKLLLDEKKVSLSLIIVIPECKTVF